MHFLNGSPSESHAHPELHKQYFALSGLKTNLGLLNNGLTWGYTILTCVVAFLAKFIPCSVAAKAFGFTSRESSAVGVLMACKG